MKSYRTKLYIWQRRPNCVRNSKTNWSNPCNIEGLTRNSSLNWSWETSPQGPGIDKNTGIPGRILAGRAGSAWGLRGSAWFLERTPPQLNWHYPLKSKKLQPILYAMRNLCFGSICWGLKSSKLQYTQCEFNFLVISDGSKKLQTLLYAMRNQCFGTICWGLRNFKLYYTQCEINVSVLSAEV